MSLTEILLSTMLVLMIINSIRSEFVFRRNKQNTEMNRRWLMYFTEKEINGLWHDERLEQSDRDKFYSMLKKVQNA